jgi:lipid A 4'-phosphatase
MHARWQIWLASFAVLSTVFATWPEIDIAVSAVFHDPAGWVGASGVPQILRSTIWTLTETLTLALLALLVMGLLAGPGRKVSLRVWGFAVGAMLLGPGLLVNGLLKEHWGRVRPRELVDFGGTGSFTPPFRVAGGCDGNCSFVSGEVAGVVAMGAILWFLSAGPLSARGRLAVLIAAGTTAGVVAILRVAAGGHFLSDVVFATLFTLATTALAWRAAGAATAVPALTLAALRQDAAAARARLARMAERITATRLWAMVPKLSLTPPATFRRCSGAQDDCPRDTGVSVNSRGEGG